jgi:hypothetical protein
MMASQLARDVSFTDACSRFGKSPAREIEKTRADSDVEGGI